MSALAQLGFTRAETHALLREMSPADRDDLFALIRSFDERAFYRMDPASWMEDKLGIPKHTIIWSQNPGYLESGRIDEFGEIVPTAWDGTPDPINAILQGLARWEDVAVESATGTGKTYLAGAIVLWFLAVFPGATVVTVAPTESHLVRNLWKEISRHKKRFVQEYPEVLFQSLRVKMAPNDDELSEAWNAYGFVAGVGAGEESATRARGIHAEHLLFVLDEQNGIDPAVLEAIENTCTAPHNLRVALGNPNSVTDTLHQMATMDSVTQIVVSAYDHPNIVGNDEDVPLADQYMVINGAVSWKRIFKARDKYGPEPEFYNVHPLYQAMVRGICPTGSSQNLFTGKVFAVVGAFIERNPTQRIPELCRVHEAEGGERLEGETLIFSTCKHTHLDRYIVFADVAGDELEGDWHAAVVFDRIEKRPAAIVRMRGHRRYYALELLRVAELYRVMDWRTETRQYPMLSWERNAVGALHLVSEFAAYPNLYRPRAVDRPKKSKRKNAWGNYTSAKTRPEIIRSLEEWGLTLRQAPERVVDLLVFQEMQTFEYHNKKRRYQHREAAGCHDDILMALGWALVLDETEPDPRDLPDKPDDQRLKQEQLHDREMRKAKRRARGKRNQKYGSIWDKAPISGGFGQAR